MNNRILEWPDAEEAAEEAAKNRRPWPSREEWAQQQRTPYYDTLEKNLPVSDRLSDYATPAEIEAAVTALQDLWKAEGRKLRAAKRIAGPLAQQPNENGRAYYERRRQMLPADGDIADAVDDARWHRQDINKILAEIRNDELHPYRARWTDVETIIAPFLDRYRAAWHAAADVRRREIEATPIDDAAWEAELRWRAEAAE